MNRITLASLTFVSGADGVPSGQIADLMPRAAIRDGGYIYVMRPERHTHPRAQERFALNTIRRVNEGARIIIQSHSEIVLLTIQTEVALGHLDVSKVALVWFDAALVPHIGKLNRAGRYGDWPVDFSEHMLGLQRRYLDAAEDAVLTGKATRHK